MTAAYAFLVMVEFAIGLRLGDRRAASTLLPITIWLPAVALSSLSLILYALLSIPLLICVIARRGLMSSIHIGEEGGSDDVTTFLAEPDPAQAIYMCERDKGR